MIDRNDLLSARVPRYTSYPTAPHFHSGIDEATYRRWLNALADDASMSLYLHIPFCDTLCWFCGCHTSVVNHYQPITAYLDDLRMEMSAVSDIVGKKHPVRHLHWGGGSPTILTPDDFLRLSDDLHRQFSIAEGAQFAVEIDPRGLSDAVIAAMAEAGVNRASIGVQDESQAVQKAINRQQPHTVTRAAVERLRTAGINALNIDLIYGLPHQGEIELAHTIERTLELKPNRLAVFGYAHVPHFKKHMNLIDTATLPDAGARLKQFDLAHRLLTAAGYVPIGLDHFALPDDTLTAAAANGALARNFQGYTDDTAEALIGLGASAIGRLPQGYVQNTPSVPEYRKAVANGAFAVARGVELSAEDRLRRTIIDQLMCQLHVDLDAAAKPFGKKGTDFSAEIDRLQPLATMGYVRIEGTRITVPPEARAAVRLAAAIFDTYLPQGGSLHSVAV